MDMYVCVCVCVCVCVLYAGACGCVGGWGGGWVGGCMHACVCVGTGGRIDGPLEFDARGSFAQGGLA